MSDLEDLLSDFNKVSLKKTKKTGYKNFLIFKMVGQTSQSTGATSAKVSQPTTHKISHR